MAYRSASVSEAAIVFLNRRVWVRGGSVTDLVLQHAAAMPMSKIRRIPGSQTLTPAKNSSIGVLSP